MFVIAANSGAAEVVLAQGAECRPDILPKVSCLEITSALNSWRPLFTVNQQSGCHDWQVKNTQEECAAAL